jgi:ABC-type spermidine/putrescine transport system permease subunit II
MIKAARNPSMAARWLAVAFATLVLMFLIVPTFIIVPISFSSDPFLSFPPPGLSLRWYQAFSGSLDYQQALLNSMLIGLPVALLSTILGTAAAVPVVRGDLPGRRLIAALLIAPLILPQIVLAIGMYPVMARLGLIGTYPAILLGHTVVCMPLVFITVSAALQTYPPTFELAAMTLGATWWQTFWTVTFPMLRPAVITGFVFAFTFSFDELILAMFLTSPTTRTLPRLLWEQLNYQMTPVIAAATTIVLCITISLLLGGALVSRRLLKS